MSMIASPFSLIQLNEAEVSHGKVVSIQLSHLPPPIQARMKEALKNKGISEKEFEGMQHNSETDFSKENIPHLSSGSGGVDFKDKPISLHGNDVIDGKIMHELEHYDKKVDEAILSSNDIVKAYNATIDAKFDEALKYIKHLEELYEKYGDDVPESEVADVQRYVQTTIHKGTNLPLTILVQLNDDITFMKKNFGASDSDIKKWICEAVYQPSENPEEIKRIVNARIKYNNTIISFFKNMLQINYNILGLTKDEAMTLSAKLSSPSQSQSHKAIKDVKSIIVKNADKYKIGKASYDFRPLGLGCMFMTEEDVGSIEKTVQVDRMIQMLTQYDAIVVGHGSSGSDEYERGLDKLLDQYSTDVQNLRDKEQKETKTYGEKIDNYFDTLDLSTPEIKALEKEFNQVESQLKGSYFSSDAHKEITKQIDQLQNRFNNGELSYEEWEEQFNKLSKMDLDNLDEDHKERQVIYRKLDKIFDEINRLKRNVKIDMRHKIESGELEANDDIKQAISDLNTIGREYAKKRSNIQDKSMKDMARFYKHMRKNDKVSWQIQPVKTLNGGPYTDVNDLVRQLIKEGFKNINLVACNPGRHTLAKDILNTPGVKIHHATTSLLAESTYYYNSEDAMIESAFAEIDKNIRETHQHLSMICEESNIPYWDDEFLDECVGYFESGAYMEVLVEGALANAWTKLKELVKKALGFIIGIFKKLLELIGKLIARIKDFFKRVFGSNRFEKKFQHNIKSGVIMVESASLKRHAVSSWEEMQANITKACEKITSKIKETEAKQTKNMQDLEKYSEQKAKSVNESSNVQLDTLLGLIL